MKKSTTETRKSAYTAESFANGAKKRLELKQIRVFVEKLLAQPDGAPMPDWSELSIGDRFAIVRRLVPADQREEVTGKSDSQHQRYEQGMDIPLTVVAALAAETEIPLEWIVSGKAMDRRPPLVYVSPEQPQADAEDVAIQKLAFKASAGSGAMVLQEIAEHVRFPRAILEHAGVVPQNARLLEASGESMRSTINDGDTLLVDVSTAAIQIVEGKIYVFSVGDDAYVKRLRRLGEQVLMISDNREMFPEPEEVPKHLPLRVYGRVKWAGRNL